MALLQFGYHRTAWSAVFPTRILGPFEELAVTGKALELCVADEVVLDTVGFAGARFPGRGGDAEVEWKPVPQPGDNGAFPDSGRAGDDYQQALVSRRVQGGSRVDGIQGLECAGSRQSRVLPSCVWL